MNSDILLGMIAGFALCYFDVFDRVMAASEAA